MNCTFEVLIQNFVPFGCQQYANVLKFYEYFFLCVHIRPYVDIIKLN